MGFVLSRGSAGGLMSFGCDDKDECQLREACDATGRCVPVLESTEGRRCDSDEDPKELAVLSPLDPVADL